MPVVPFAQQSQPAPAMPKVDPQWILMAAAQMNSEGRLFTEPKDSSANAPAPAQPR